MQINKITIFTFFWFLFISISCKKNETVSPVAQNSPPSPKLPTLITNEISKISTNSALSGGNISNDGGAAITERGLVWSTNQNPDYNLKTKIKNGEGVGSFESELLGLNQGTKYFVRSYAVNSKGVSYGNEISFSTISENIYAVGNKVGGVPNTVGLLWINNEETRLKHPANNNLIANNIKAICLNNNDIHLIGTIEVNGTNINFYWKNGNMINLQPVSGSNGWGFNSIAAYGTDIYIGGTSYGSNTSAVIWKNGVPSIISQKGSISSLTVSEGNVYAVGSSFWFNGNEVPVNGMNRGNSVFVYANDVYIAGSTSENNQNSATYWKNGVKTKLSTNGESGDSQANSVFVEDSDVYVIGTVGSGSKIFLWKNGEVASVIPMSKVTSVFVKKGIIYVSGSTRENVGDKTGRPGIWINGTIKKLNDNVNGIVNSIIVTN